MANFSLAPSVLFTPANKPERFAKGIAMGATGIIIDLEDSVGLSEKESARKIAFDYLKEKRDDKAIILLRINSIDTQAGLADLLALSQTALPGCDGIVHPKTESAAALSIIDNILTTYQTRKPLFAIIETSIGVARIDKIAKSKAIAGLMFGAADYTVSARCELSARGLLFARSKIANAAAMQQLACYDSPYFDFHNEAGLSEETDSIKSLGFTGKLAIHPNQIATINHTFTPSKEQYADAKAIIKLYDDAKGSACQYKGKMIDVPIYKLAKRTVMLYETLALNA